MKIEVKDYYDVCEREEYWIGRETEADLSNVSLIETSAIVRERKKWTDERKHLEELAGVKEEYGDND